MAVWHRSKPTAARDIWTDVVPSGTLEKELDGGEIARLGAGDLIVQRGTSHLWRNPSANEPCRIVMSMIESKAVTIDAAPLPSTLD